jgi:hypothetical protein
MQPRSTDNGLASFTIETPTTSDTADTDTMGRAYRTPSLKPEEYISSSKYNVRTWLDTVADDTQATSTHRREPPHVS